MMLPRISTLIKWDTFESRNVRFDGGKMTFEMDRKRVFYICKVCGYVFLEDPGKMPIRCPQCDSENTERT
jgi:rubrerythrin